MKKVFSILSILAISLSVTSCQKDLGDYKSDLKDLVEKQEEARQNNDEAAYQELDQEIHDLSISAKENLTPEEFDEYLTYGFSLYK